MKKVLPLLLITFLAGCSLFPKEAAPVITAPPVSFATEEFARVDGAASTQPLSRALSKIAMGNDEAAQLINHTGQTAVMNVINGEADIAFTTYPTNAELSAAREAGIPLEIVPVANDAFIFITNAGNPVNNLTQEQLRLIYSGAITNWKDVGGEDIKIRAYQHPDSVGSQTEMRKFMGEIPLARGEGEFAISSKGALVETLGTYNNAQDAIGYTYYFYYNTMFLQDSVKIIGVDGFVPTKDSIANGQYSLMTPYYAVIKKDAATTSFARRFMNYALSDRGQQAVEAAGYIPL